MDAQARTRRFLGYMGILLPTLDWVGAVVFSGWVWNVPSISATHYAGSYLVFESLMCVTGVFLLYYDGYDIRDKWLARIAGIGGLALAFFPCALPDYPVKNFFMLPANVTNVIHLAGAGVFFIFLFIIIFFQFTKSGGKMTPQKVRRNLVYRVCGIVMLFALVAGFGASALFSIQGVVYLGEKIALEAFGSAWLVKGEAVQQLNDKKWIR